MKIIYVILVLFISTYVDAKYEPEKVEPSLLNVSHGFNFRLLVYSACSPEHCWSETYLQSVSFWAKTPSILCNKKIDEIAIGYVIKEISWAKVNGKITASLSASASHGGFEPHIVTIRPDDKCNYEIQGVSTTGY